jgi:hypothetical protein
MSPLELFSQAFEDFFCRFFTIEVGGSSKELEAFIV